MNTIIGSRVALSLVAVALLAVAGCTAGEGEGEGEASADGCVGLCTDAGYDDGEETDFDNGLIECQCEGSGDAIAQDDCNAYCADVAVEGADPILSGTDKCVCDGTTP